MKRKFSRKWKSSKKKRKQIKYRANAPLHLRNKFMNSNLSKELRKKYNRRSFPVRKGDSVRVMRGKFNGRSGKVSEVDLKKLKVGIEGMQIQKKDGTKVNVYFYPSKLQIQELNLDDKERIKAISKEKKVEEKKVEEKKEGKKQESKNVGGKNASEKA